MLPHVVNRPLAIVRCPDGEGGQCFFQKQVGKGMPKGVESVRVADADGDVKEQIIIRDAEGLLGLVQMSALEVHPWGARADKVERPDRLVFDLDPGPGIAWKDLVKTAFTVREALAQLGLTGFPKTTGGKGLHVVVPITRRATWEEAKGFTKAVAETLVRLFPNRLVAVMSKDRRAGRIYVDYLRNARGATAVAAYSTRARPGGLVSLPVSWAELESGIDPAAFHVLSVPKLLASGRADPWEDLDAHAARLPTAG
jgi:bifunctional non-homologous end joining protein LigD